jgi:hypothetical protein
VLPHQRGTRSSARTAPPAAQRQPEIPAQSGDRLDQAGARIWHGAADDVT